jgi:CRISP-associated protein Cas1
MPVRRLHNFAYCPRLFYYQWVENIFVANADTVEGSRVHSRTDEPSAWTQDRLLPDLPEGAKIRSLALESASLGLSGKIDLIEGSPDGLELLDYKKGSAGRDDHGERVAKHADRVQIAAYAMLVAEAGTPVARASIYYASERRRVAVDLSEELFAEVNALLGQARCLAEQGQCPPPLEDDPRCLYCSAYPVCLPGESAWWREDSSPPPKIRIAPRPENDEGEVLVVQTPRARLGQRGDQVVVSLEGEPDRKLPLRQLRAVYLYGPVQMSAQLTHKLLEQGIDVAYFSPAGRFLGLLRGLPASGVDARRGQYRLFDQPGVRLQLARETVRAKIHNQRVMLMRNGDVPERILDVLAVAREQAMSAADLDALRAVEGGAASVYFNQFASMIKDSAGVVFDFTGRNRRPPRDPVNALLSLAYSVLAKELTGVCHAVGLDPFLGFFHQPRYGRPALALDLMEEFRPLVADSVAISLINRGEVGESDFFSSASGTFLNERGRRSFWEAWARRLDSEVTHPQFGYRMAYRRMLEVQARQLWRFVRGEAGRYHAFTTR